MTSESIAIDADLLERAADESQLEHEEGAGEVCVARGLRHDRGMGEGLEKLWVRDETRRAPTTKAPEGVHFSSVPPPRPNSFMPSSVSAAWMLRLKAGWLR